MTSRFLGSLLLFSGFLPAPTGRPLQTDSPARFYALVGDDVTLPCLLPMPDVTLVNLVEWYRMDRQSLGSNQQTILHAVRNGLALVKDQDPQYRGRTAIMANGSLELRNVTPRDYGNLNCKVLRPQSERREEIAVVSLIQAKVSEINLTVHQSVVHCKSSGWSPEPLISLVNATGNAFPAQKEPPVEEGGLFTVSVHLNITAFKGSETLICRVEIPGSRVLREKTITVTIPVTEVDSLEGGFWNPVIFAMLGLGLTLSILSFLFVVYMRRPKIQVLMDILMMTTTGASEDTAKNNKTFDEHGTEKVIALDDPEEVDSVTPGGDFANDVVARAQWFAAAFKSPTRSARSWGLERRRAPARVKNSSAAAEVSFDTERHLRRLFEDRWSATKHL